MCAASPAQNKKAAKAGALVDTVPSLRHIVVLDGGPPAPTNGAAPAGPAKPGRIVSYASLMNSGQSVPPIVPAPTDTAGLIYTSGTTGNPKGVILTHLNIASNVSATHEIFPMEFADRSLSFLPWAHVFGQTVELHTLLSTGAAMAICEGVDRILDNLAEVQPTLLFSVPRIFNKIYTAVQQQISARPMPVQILVQQAFRITAKERAEQPCIGPDRADLVLAGAAILQAVQELWPCSRVRVADRGLREGILLSLMADRGSRHRRRRRRGPRRAEAAE